MKQNFFLYCDIMVLNKVEILEYFGNLKFQIFRLGMLNYIVLDISYLERNSIFK